MGNVDFDAEGNVVVVHLFKFSVQVEAWQKQEGQRESEASAEVVDAERTRPRQWIWYRSWYRHQRT